MNGSVIFLASTMDPLADGDQIPVRADGLIEYVSGNGLRSAPTLETWDTRSGHRVVVSIVDATGVNLDLTPDRFDLAEYDSRSVFGDELFWLHPDGHLVASTISTGQTRLVQSVTPRGEGVEHWASFTDTHLFVVSVIPHEGSPQALLSVYALPSGHLVRSTQLSWGELRLPDGLLLRGIAANPDWDSETP